MTTELLKAKVVGGLFLTYSIQETTEDNISNEIEFKSNFPIHDDLKEAFKELKPHVAMLMGFTEDLRVNHQSQDLDNIEPVRIDFGTRQSVALGFNYSLPELGIPANINIPKVDYVAHESIYTPMKKLMEVVDVIYSEVLSYHNGKHGAGKQLSLDLDGNLTGGESFDEKPKGKRGRKKKAVDEFSEPEL